MSDFDSSVPSCFRVIPDYPHYAINESGNIISICRNGGRTIRWCDAKRVKPTITNRGYHRVGLFHDGKQRIMFVHRLVLTTFVGPRPDGLQCRHLDGNPANNHVSNLKWGTPRENQCDRFLHGTDDQGERCYKAKLTVADVLAIRARAANGERHSDIAKDFPVTRKSISQIVRRETWKHI
jgi:hypothetical protein